MAHKYAELRALPTEKLVERYDATAESTQVGLAFYRDELMRREFDAQNQVMLSMTRDMRWMTAAMTVMTVVNLVLVWLALWKS